MPWKDVEQVYDIAYLEGHSHWVCYALNLAAQEVVVYDSLGPSGVRHVEDAFKFVQRNLAILLRRHGWRGIGPKEGLKDRWALVIERDVPHQTNGADYGVLAYKFMQCLASGNSIKVLKPPNCTDDEFSLICCNYRKSICVDLVQFDVVKNSMPKPL